MKKIFVLFFFGLSLPGFGQGDACLVKGEMPANHAHITLMYNKGNNTHIRKEVEVIDGKFEIRDTIQGPYKVYLKASYPGEKAGSSDDQLAFFLDGGTTFIRTRDSLKHAELSGPALVSEGQAYDLRMSALEDKMTADYDALDRGATDADKKTAAYQRAAQAIEDSFLVQQKRENIAFVKAHPASRLCLYIFREQTYGYEYAELVPLWEGVSPFVRGSEAGKLYAARLERLKMVALGQVAPDFQHPDSTGKMVRLSSFRGRYVLIDFWASWCGPCRGESPYLVAAHDKYRERGFEIIGISLDKKAQRRQWLQAIHHDNLNWTQLSDLSDVNPVVQLYGVKGIPQNFLLDPEGRIIAHNLRGELLEKKLDSIMKKVDHLADGKKLVPFSVKGQVGHFGAPYMAFLSYISPQGFQTDSVELVDGRFAFSGMVKTPRKAYLSISAEKNGQHMRRDTYETFYLEQDEVLVESPDSLSHVHVQGGKVNEDYQAFKGVGEMDFMRSHPASWVSLMTMLDDYYAGRDLALYKSIFDGFSEELKASSTGVYLAPLIESASKTAIGSAAMDFAIPDVAGRKHGLREFRGKYVLVDFWASWCGPCRAENPNVLKAYNAFKDKGFTVVGISIDEDKDKAKWMEAIRKDGMPWTQLSELKGWQSPVAQGYGINAIPQNFLLDPEGRIVAKGLRGEDLMAKLGELMKK